MPPLTRLFASRWFLTLLGVMLLCVLIWFAGPYFAFADAKPLTGVADRLVAVLVVVAVWALIWQWKQWRAGRASQALATAAAPPAQSAAAAQDRRVSGADAQLEQKFREAMTALRRSKGGKRSLADLPWYVIIGPPGAGKTTAFKNSGLEFPLEDRFGKTAIRGVGGTRSCDWWLTTEAVLLDTAGRYTLQDSNEAADASGWVEFLKLLKDHRRRRPINGVLLALSLAEIAAFTDAEREKHVLAIRRRLDELHRYLGIQLPVYVLLTKADLIAGFNEYFENFDARDRAQVWGVTFPLEDSQRGRAQDQLATALDGLIERLSSGITDRLQAERDPKRRRAIFAFPQQLASLSGGITTFVREIFASSALDGQVWLRGVYLTSGTQEGTPIDRMIGALARTFGLGAQALPGAQGHGKAFFIHKLLRDVVFAEAGLAGGDRKAELRTAAALGAAYALVALVAVGVVIGMLVSYRANAGYLGEVATAAQPLAAIKSVGPDASLTDTLPPLDALRAVLDAARSHRRHVPLHMRFGLYQGGTMSAAAEDAYFREINLSLAPAAARELASRIESSGSQPDQLYEYLKAYLMLGEPKHLDRGQIEAIAHAEWANSFASDPSSVARLDTHFDALVSRPGRLQPVTLDADLIERARASLQQASLPLLMYSRVRLAYAADTDDAIRLDKQLGLGAQMLFLRRSGVPLDQPFPALYTRKVFDEFNARGKLPLVKEFLEADWVMGDHAIPMSQSSRLTVQVVQLYEQDYIRAWDALLADITVRRPRDTADAAAVLGTLASPTSPLKRLLLLVNANTNFSQARGGAGGSASVASKVGLTGGRLDKILGVSQGPQPGGAITQHFASLDALVAEPPGQAPIDGLLAAMGQAQQQLQSATGLTGQPGSTSVLSGIESSLAAVQAQTRQMPPMVGSLIGGLTEASQGAATGVAHSEFENRYETQVANPCRQLIGSSFPFNPSSPTDVTLADFARVFATGGLYDSFFQSNLAPLVDTSRSPWRWREGARAIGGPAALLGRFQQADRIRQVFFSPGSQSPSIRFNVTPYELDADVDRFRLNIDGQSLEYHHGPQQTVPMSWPGGPVGEAVLSFDLHTGQQPQLASQGPWALFRLLGQAMVQQRSQTEFLATFRIDGRQASILIDAASVLNPFAHGELARFRCDE